MKSYIEAIFPAEFKRNTAFWRGFVLGLVMMILAVFQLFQFEDFPSVIEMMGLPGGVVAATVLAILFPLLEIGSLPYLLSLRVPAALRRISKWSMAAVGILWIVVTVWTSLVEGPNVDSGIFGATLATSSGWWSVAFALLLSWSMYLTMRELPKRRDS